MARSLHAQLNSPRVSNGMSFNNAAGGSDQGLPSINSGLPGMRQSNSDAGYPGRNSHPR